MNVTPEEQRTVPELSGASLEHLLADNASHGGADRAQHTARAQRQSKDYILKKVNTQTREERESTDTVVLIYVAKTHNSGPSLLYYSLPTIVCVHATNNIKIHANLVSRTVIPGAPYKQFRRIY